MRFHPIVHLAPETVLLDLSGDRPDIPPTPWSIGRYDELRPAVYTTTRFAGGRCLHLGVDLGAPVGTPVHAFAAGRIEHAGFNPGEGDYGHVLVTAHQVEGRTLYVLLGHLSRASVTRWSPGDRFARGEVLGWLGDREENGNWPPHVHVQLSWTRPPTHDMPGTTHPDKRRAALAAYPDPRLILGPIY